MSIAKQTDKDDQNGLKAGPIQDSQSLFGEDHSKEERTSLRTQTDRSIKGTEQVGGPHCSKKRLPAITVSG